MTPKSACSVRSDSPIDNWERELDRRLSWWTGSSQHGVSIALRKIKCRLHVRHERRWFTAGESPARELFAPPGSNRSGGEGNEAVGASGVEGRIGDSASMPAVT